MEFTDPDVGAIRLTGALSAPAGAQALVIVVHGLGGCSQSPYVVAAAAELVAAGFACLRLNLRGADRTGEDIYHAGLTADLVATLASPEVAAFDDVVVLGFSLGGHVTLRLLVDEPPSHLRAGIAICPPVDLAAAAMTIDSPSQWIYRRYLLRRLLEIYGEVAARRAVARSVAEVRAARTFVEFDSLVIAPRYGFADAWDYYATVSVAPALAAIEIPTLIVAAQGDPMIPAASLEAAQLKASDSLDFHWSPGGGHLSFPRRFDLGIGGALGLYPQILGWLDERLGV